ncbi:ABC transporter substrate-binding protein [Cohnella abietis]|uniref:Iron(3+)-hydroxamate-binding protein YxeB n=1 Tax=Cohnella abietis TaxID=2507935 RepID=A0A3T1CYP4_9BACL|nr:ABC transporter substrate-binding protein [Cohnella abietis]BBI30948.1 iron(3+)-hydroxamate-binding protein YxeB [Cohnella abietis]
MFSRQPHDKRRLSVMVSLLLLLTIIVSACGATNSNSSENSSTLPPSASASVAPSEETGQASPDTAKFKTVSTVNGDIEIPVHPKRIVAEEYLGSLIVLNVIPIGAPGLTLQNYYYKEALTGVADTGVYGKPSAESILALNPDLIITANGDSYELLSKIAPTLVIPYGNLKNAHEELTYFGSLLGKEEEAKTWLVEFDSRIAAAKAKVDAAIPADASFSIMEDGGKTTWAYGDNFGRGGQPIYQALGRKPPSGVAEEIMTKQWAEISPELLDKYSGDYIVITSNN